MSTKWRLWVPDSELREADHLDKGFLAEVFKEIGDCVYDVRGLQLLLAPSCS